MNLKSAMLTNSEIAAATPSVNFTICMVFMPSFKIYQGKNSKIFLTKLIDKKSASFSTG
jgi:hypothetical protein